VFRTETGLLRIKKLPELIDSRSFNLSKYNTNSPNKQNNNSTSTPRSGNPIRCLDVNSEFSALFPWQLDDDNITIINDIN